MGILEANTTVEAVIYDISHEYFVSSAWHIWIFVYLYARHINHKPYLLKLSVTCTAIKKQIDYLQSFSFSAGRNYLNIYNSGMIYLIS